MMSNEYRDNFIPTSFELEVIRHLSKRHQVRVHDCWCGQCAKRRYMLIVDDTPDYLCLTCRLGERK
jgi:hypothetical protein